MTASASPHRWFVVQARSGSEQTVAQDLRNRIERTGMADQFGQVLVPTEEVVGMVKGQPKTSTKVIFPGYVLVQIAMDTAAGLSTDAWHLVRSTAKVLGFIGGSAERPLPISDQEAERILNRIEATKDKPRAAVSFRQGDVVRITEGPFKDFQGVVESMDVARASVRVAVSVFGRATPVDFKVDQLMAD